MRKYLIIITILCLLLNSFNYAKEYEVLEVENNKQISLDTLQKLYEKADYSIYIGEHKLTNDLLDSFNASNTFHYIGFNNENKHFFELYSDYENYLITSETQENITEESSIIEEITIGPEVTTEKQETTIKEKETKIEETQPIIEATEIQETTKKKEIKQETQQIGNYKITLNGLNVREQPNTNKETKILGVITKNQTINVTEFYNQYWAIIDFNGQTGYISAKYLIPTDNSQTITENAQSNSDNERINKTQTVDNNITPIEEKVIEGKVKSLTIDKWKQQYRGKTFTITQFISKIKELKQPTLIYLTSSIQRISIELNSATLTENQLVDLANKEGCSNIEIPFTNSEDDDYIYIIFA